MNDTMMTQLRQADPAREIEQAGLSDAALAALREGVLLTPREPAPTRRRWRRPVAVLGGAAVIVAGGGMAYAAYERMYVGGDRLTCLTEWPEESFAEGSGGVPLTGDDIADCQRYQELTGGPYIEDPMVIRRGDMRIVAPRDQVPAEYLALEVLSDDTAAVIRELTASMGDWIDGGRSQCFTAETASAFVAGELDRLGLQDWTYHEGDGSNGGPCGEFSAHYDETGEREVWFYPERQPDPTVPWIYDPDQPEEWIRSDEPGPLWDFRWTLRDEIANSCVSLEEAKTIVNREIVALGPTHPTTFLLDEGLSCANVDMEVAGSVQVTVRGPSVARP